LVYSSGVIYGPSGIGVEPVVLVRRSPAGCGGSKQFDGRGSAVNLEAGKKYVLNNGEVVGPIHEITDNHCPYKFFFDCPNNGRMTWTKNGDYVENYRGHPASISGISIAQDAEHPSDREQGEMQLIRNAFNTHFPEWTLFNEQKTDVMVMVEQIASLKRNIVAMDEHLRKCEEERMPVEKDRCMEIVEKIARVIVDTAEEWKRESNSK